MNRNEMRNTIYKLLAILSYIHEVDLSGHKLDTDGMMVYIESEIDSIKEALEVNFGEDGMSKNFNAYDEIAEKFYIALQEEGYCDVTNTFF